MHGCAGFSHVTQLVLELPGDRQLVPLRMTVVELASLLPFCLIATRVIGWRPFLFHHSLTPGAHRENADWLMADFGRTAIS